MGSSNGLMFTEPSFLISFKKIELFRRYAIKKSLFLIVITPFDGTNRRSESGGTHIAKRPNITSVASELTDVGSTSISSILR